MATPSFLNKSNNVSIPVSFLAKESSAPKFLGKEVESKSSITIQADFALAQLVWFAPADLDLRSVCKNGTQVEETYYGTDTEYGERHSKYAFLNEDSGVRGTRENDINPYTGKRENCYSEMLYMGNAEEQRMLVHFFQIKDQNYRTFASLNRMARLVLLKQEAPGKKSGFFRFGSTEPKLVPVHYIDVIFESDSSANYELNKWLECFKIFNKDDGYITVEYVGKYSRTKPDNSDIISTPYNRVRKELPGFNI
jgi:hypothetical protein